MKITQILIFLVVSFLLLACGSKKNADEQTKQEVQAVSTHEINKSKIGDKVMYYTCPMESHKHIHSQEAVKCPECNMELVAVVESNKNNMDFYGCPMPIHSHVRSYQPGKCDECGMDLMPMRLEKELNSNKRT